jgi:uncharacterized protein with PIN domain
MSQRRELLQFYSEWLTFLNVNNASVNGVNEMFFTFNKREERFEYLIISPWKGNSAVSSGGECLLIAFLRTRWRETESAVRWVYKLLTTYDAPVRIFESAALVFAAGHDMLDVTVHLLREAKLHKTSILDALELACQNGSTQVAGAILSEIRAGRITCSSMAALAASRGHNETLRLLIEYAARHRLKLNLGNAFVYACAGGHLGSIQILFWEGVTDSTSTVSKAIEVSRDYNRPESIDMLIFLMNL